MRDRGPVVHLDRSLKAQMIEAFLKDVLSGEIASLAILDVGCGNGQISSHFCQKNRVWSVDVEDKRSTVSGEYDFRLVDSELLPFEDGMFDIVISHHVIEHVNDQNTHMREVKRVLKNEGVIYLGCPNRSSPFMAGHKGNQSVLRLRQMEDLFERHGLSYDNVYIKWLKHPDKYFCETRLLGYFPEILLKMLKAWFPSQCFILRKAQVPVLESLG